MMNEGTLLAEASAWMANQVMVRGTVVLGAALLASWALARWSGEARHAVWVLATCALVAGPMLGVASDALSPGGRTVMSETSAVAVGPPLAPGTATASNVPSDGRFKSPRTSTRRGVPEELIWLWAAGAVALLAALLRDVWRAERLRPRTRSSDARLLGLFHEVQDAVGLRSAAALAVHPELTVPAVVGGRQPLVLLPADAESWPADQLRSAIRHELAHVVRHDYVLHLLGRCVLALYWPNPLAWVARGRLDEERERACDERVVAWGSSPTEYARHLVQVARRARGARLGSAAALSGRRGIAGRVAMILRAEATHRRWSRRSWMAGLAVAGVVVTLATAVTPFTTRQEARRSTALAELRSDEVSVRMHAAWMLGELASARDVDVLEAELASPSAEVRLMAAWALGEIKLPRSVPALVPLLDDPEAGVREMAVLSLGELEAPAAVEAIVDASRRHAGLGEPSRWALLQIGGPRLLDRLGPSGGRPTPDAEVWSGRLAGVAVSATDVTQAIVALSAGSPDERRRAALSLGHRGDERAVDALLVAVRDPSADVRAAAVWALDEINPSR